MPGISIHVVDVVHGAPALGLRVQLNALRAGASPREVGAGAVGGDGQVAHPMVQGAGIECGEHEVLLHVAEFYRSAGPTPADAPTFLEVAAFRFNVGSLDEHYHLPFKISPWGLSVWRGR